MGPQRRKILTVDELIWPRSAPPTVEKTYSAPQRFDLTSMFVMMVVYAILLAGMKALGFYPIVIVIITVFIATIGCAQALFHKSPPRRVSVVSGAVLGSAGWLVIVLWSLLVDEISESLAIGLILVLPVALIGAFFGYVAGALVGGVFLVADVLRHRYGQTEDTLDQNTFDGG